MGLDMYLYGQKFVMDNMRKEDEYPIQTVRLEVGYWRKDWGLHAYIINNFADGVNEAQEVRLTTDNLKQIIEALQGDEILRSEDDPRLIEPSFDEESIRVLNSALKWAETKEKYVIKDLIYRGSW